VFAAEIKNNQKLGENMKRLVIVLMMMLFSIIVIAQEQKSVEITLEQAMEKFLPEFEIAKEIQLEGIGLDFAYAKETGDIVAVTETDEAVHLQYLLPDGSLKWKKEFRKASYSCCHISDNGKGVTFSQGEYDEHYLLENYAFDSEGDLLFEKKQYDALLKTSPDGSYFFNEYQRGIIAANNLIEIFDVKGNPIKNFLMNNTVYDNEAKFLEKDIVLLYYAKSYESGGNIALCKIENNELVILWEINSEKITLCYPIKQESLVCYEKPYICFGYYPYKVVSIDNKEIFNFSDLLPYTTFPCSFIDNQTILLLSAKDKSARILDLSEGKVIDSFEWKLGDYDTIESARFHNNDLILGNYEKTLFIERSTELFYKLDLKLLSNLNNNQLILAKKGKDAIILILRSK